MQSAPWLGVSDRDDAVALIFKDKINPSWSLGDEGQLAVDVFETATELLIQSTIAGVKPEDLEISLQSDLLTIRGKRENPLGADGGRTYHHAECYWGAFSRSIILPVPVKSEGGTSSLKSGVLTIRLRKADPKQTIKVKVED